MLVFTSIALFLPVLGHAECAGGGLGTNCALLLTCIEYWTVVPPGFKYPADYYFSGILSGLRTIVLTTARIRIFVIGN